MSVTVSPRLHRELRESRSVLFEIGSADERLAPAVTVLWRRLAELREADEDGETTGVAFLPAPVPLPGRHLLLVDFGGLSDELVLTVPELMAGWLREEGVRDAVLGLAERSDRLDVVTGFGTAARAWLRGPVRDVSVDAPPPPPLALLDAVVDWIQAQRHRDDELVGFVYGIETVLTPGSLRPVVAAVLSTPPPAAEVTLAAGDFATRSAAGAVLGDWRNAVPAASLTAAGYGWTAAKVARRMRDLRELVRRHADAVVWAGVDVEADSRRADCAPWRLRLPRPDVPDRPDVEHVADVLVPDALWCQVLSPGHLERLGGVPAGAEPLPGGRVMLTVGEPEQWLPGHPDGTDVRARARDLLAGCLVGAAEAGALTGAWFERQRRPQVP